MDRAENIGWRIKNCRQAKHLTQKELAAKTGCTHCSISHWEEGVRYMSVYNLMLLCDALGVSANYLLTGKE